MRFAGPRNTMWSSFLRRETVLEQLACCGLSCAYIQWRCNMRRHQVSLTFVCTSLILICQHHQHLLYSFDNLFTAHHNLTAHPSNMIVNIFILHRSQMRVSSADITHIISNIWKVQGFVKQSFNSNHWAIIIQQVFKHSILKLCSYSAAMAHIHPTVSQATPQSLALAKFRPTNSGSLGAPIFSRMARLMFSSTPSGTFSMTV